MSDKQWTRGPWVASTMTMKLKAWAQLNATREPLDVVVRGEDVIAVVWCGDDRDGEERANARLIAAADDLYQALDDLRYQAEHLVVGEAREALDTQEARAALAKARGEHGS